jgi:hypothetical protein
MPHHRAEGALEGLGAGLEGRDPHGAAADAAHEVVRDPA